MYILRFHPRFIRFKSLEVEPQILHIMKPSVGKGEVKFGNYWVHRIKINVFFFVIFKIKFPVAAWDALVARVTLNS